MVSRSLKYLTLGLRRDKNLSDIQDPIQSLNNVLNNLFTGSSGTSFVSEDLDAIRGLQNSSVTVGKLTALADTTVKVSKETAGIIVEEEVIPRVRLQDRIENTYLITSETPAIQGGRGLNCRFIESGDINTGAKSSTGANIFDFNSQQIQEIFWSAGYFNFSSSIDPTFEDQYGGLQWTGWFTPSLRDPNINIECYFTGLFIFEVDLKEDGNWQTLASIYNDVRQVQVATSATATQTITLSPGEGKYVSIGDYWGIYNESGTNVIITLVTGDVISVDTSVNVVSGTNYFISKVLGETRTRSTVRLPSVGIGDFLKIRISAWWPNNGEEVKDKSVEFNYVSSNLFFYNMYDQKPNPIPKPLEIRQFLTDIVTPSQNLIGRSTQNRNFYSNNSASIKFSPVSGFSQILKHGPVNLTVTNYNEVIRFASSLPNALIGDIIIPTTTGTFINSLPGRILAIQDDISTDVRVATQLPNINTTLPVYVVGNKGFVDWIYGTVSGTTVTITEGNVSLLRKDYIAMTTTTAPGSWIRITNINKTLNTFTTSASLGSGNILILVYADKSLIDTSKDILCEGILGQEVQTTVSSGNTIVLKDITGVQPLQVIQFTGLNPLAPIIPNGTVVSTVTVGTKTITLSNNITAQLKADSTVVFAPAGTSINVEGCVIPLNTAPPFVGTPAGLSTATLGIKTVLANSTLSVTADNIILNLPTSSVKTVPVTPVPKFNSTLKLTISGVQYSVLATPTI